MVCSARIFLSVDQHPYLTWCGTRTDLSTLPGLERSRHGGGFGASHVRGNPGAVCL